MKENKKMFLLYINIDYKCLSIHCLRCIVVVVCVLISCTAKSGCYLLQFSLLEIWRQIKRCD